MKEPLTERQAVLYEFIISTIEQEGRQPTFEEMGAFLGNTKNAVSGHINRLETKGWLKRRDRKKDRSLEVVGVKFVAVAEVAD